jgi:hypothetical protein
MDKPQSASRILRPKNLNRNIQGGILSQGFANRVVATDSLKEDGMSVLVLHCATRRHRWHQVINVGRRDLLSGRQGSREFAKLLRPPLHFSACTGLVRNDMNGSEMAKGNQPELTPDLGAIDICATGDQIKPLLFALRQFQEFFPSVREFRNLSAKGIRKTIRVNDRHVRRVGDLKAINRPSQGRPAPTAGWLAPREPRVAHR